MSHYEVDRSENKTLFIRNLPVDALEKHIKEVYEPYGNILLAFIVNTRGTARSRGIAFVEFERHDQAEAAMAATNGMKFWDNQIRVEWAKPLPPEERERKQRLTQRKQPQDMPGMMPPPPINSPRDPYHKPYHEPYNDPYHEPDRIINDYRTEMKPQNLMIPPQGPMNQIPGRAQTPIQNRAPTPIQSRPQTPIPNRAPTPIRPETPRSSQPPAQPEAPPPPANENLIDYSHLLTDNFVLKDIKEIVKQIQSRDELLEKILGKKPQRDIDSIYRV